MLNTNIILNKNNKKSFFFKFKKKKENSNYLINYLQGWSGIELFKIEIKKNNVFNSSDLSVYSKFKKFEYNLLLKNGSVIFQNKKKKINLKQNDLFTLQTTSDDISIKAKKKSNVFIVRTKIKNSQNKSKKYNFIKNIKPRNLWGGKCISRLLQTKNITIVMFNLKKNFQFYDKGHHNEQITWLFKGKMKFFISKNSRILTSDHGVDIGKYITHGGISSGAIGFDIFFPKRKEQKYK